MHDPKLLPQLTLQWRHNGRRGVRNHQPRDCLLNLLLRHKENIRAPRPGPLWGEFTGDRWIPRTKGHKPENAFIRWRHQGLVNKAHTHITAVQHHDWSIYTPKLLTVNPLISGVPNPKTEIFLVPFCSLSLPNSLKCYVKNEDLVGATPTGDAPTTSEWSTVQFSSFQFNRLFGLKLFPKNTIQIHTYKHKKIKSTSTKDLNTITGQWHNKVVES